MLYSIFFIFSGNDPSDPRIIFEITARTNFQDSVNFLSVSMSLENLNPAVSLE